MWHQCRHRLNKDKHIINDLSNLRTFLSHISTQGCRPLIKLRVRNNLSFEKSWIIYWNLKKKMSLTLIILCPLNDILIYILLQFWPLQTMQKLLTLSFSKTLVKLLWWLSIGNIQLLQFWSPFINAKNLFRN